MAIHRPKSTMMLSLLLHRATLALICGLYGTALVQASLDSSILSRDNIDEPEEIIHHLASFGRLSEARRLAVEHHRNIKGAYQSGLKYFLEHGSQQIHSDDYNQAKVDDEDCLLHPPFDLHEDDINQAWDGACSMIEERNNNDWMTSPLTQPSYNLCCAFGPHNPWTYLRLPALNEPAIRLQLNENTLHLEQDGFLRPYQVDSVLWPSGYLLSLCMGNLQECVPQIPSHHSTFVELGCGIGAASIALGKYLDDTQQNAAIIASDFSPYARLLTEANAYHNGVNITVLPVDHFNTTSLQQMVQQYHTPFDVVYGSSLQGLFENTQLDSSPLWRALDVLLAEDGLAIFAHTKHEDKLQAGGKYELLWCRSAAEPLFGRMTTRFSDEEADFEICVFTRRRKDQQVLDEL